MVKGLIEEIEENIEELADVKKDVKEIDEASEEIDEEVEKILDEEEVVEEAEEELTGKKLEKAAKSESEENSDISKKKKALLEKAAKLKEKLSKESPQTEELKEQVKGKKKTEMLIPLEDYVKSGIYLGTRVVTPDMKPFVYRRRADGLAIFNTDLIDEKIKEGIEYISQFNPEKIIVVCKRQAGWKVVRMFSELTGIRAFTKKYPAGILTNTRLENFFENELTIVADAWLDKNALADVKKVNKKVLLICDTNNHARDADQIIIGNNKHNKSLGLMFYLLAKGYAEAKGIDKKIPEIEEWEKEEEI